MIKRIKGIQEVGVFRSSSFGSNQFEKLTVIYGENIYGKTTLSQILKSLGTDDKSFIAKRRTIPHRMANSQIVKLSYFIDGSEENIEFNGDTWSPKKAKDKVMVYDNDFTHDNFMLGNTISRDQKKNFTQFVIGERGSALNTEIGKLNEDVRILNSAKKKPDYVANESDANIISFVNMVVEESEDVLQVAIKSLDAELEIFKNTSAISNLPVIQEPHSLDHLMLLEEYLKKVNLLLSKSYKGINKEVLSFIESHKVHHTNNNTNIDSWLADGFMVHKKGDDCPFCGQKTDKARLIEYLATLLDSEHTEYLKEVSEAVDECLSYNMRFTTVYNDLSEALINLNKYTQFEPQIDLLLKQITISDVKVIENDLLALIKTLIGQIHNSCNVKKQKPNEEMDLVVIGTDIIEKVDELCERIKSITPILSSLKALVDSLKAKSSMSLPEIQIAVTKNSQIKLEVTRKLVRKQQDAQCQKYKQDVKKIKELNAKITERKGDLERDQSQYLDDYFYELNKTYKRLGNNKIELEKHSGNLGKEKLFFLKLYYDGAEVNESNYADLMSESERRSLSFAIFYTKLLGITNKDEIVLVLDDPVVSYDDNRVSCMIDIISELQSCFAQVIVFTHYKYVVKRLLRIEAEPKVFYRLTKHAGNPSIDDLNPDDFLLSEVELLFQKIHKFVNNENSEDVKSNLRLLLERYISIRYQKTLKERELSDKGLKAKIEGLRDCLSTDLYNRLQCFRNATNSVHHELDTLNTDEDVKNYASDLLNELYK